MINIRKYIHDLTTWSNLVLWRDLQVINIIPSYIRNCHIGAGSVKR